MATHYALSAQAAVQAELALAAFMQTLTRTFSYLPVGLAMFDRQRRLHLFNPALTDLTQLPFDFLSARPTFNAFLDAMRDRGCIPEPQDYAAWRQRIAALDHRGEIENYEDVWPLSSGKSYRVSARPHPEGTLALLIHDITDEMTSTRALTAELRQMQSVVDASPEAMVVFSPLGEGVFCNESYRALWPDSVGERIALPPLAQALRSWAEGCAPTPIWEEVEAYVAVPLSHQPQRHLLSLRDGRTLVLRMVPLAGGGRP